MKSEEQIRYEARKEMFNRLYDNSVGKTDNNEEAALLLVRELNKMKDEIGEEGIRLIKEAVNYYAKK